MAVAVSPKSTRAVSPTEKIEAKREIKTKPLTGVGGQTSNRRRRPIESRHAPTAMARLESGEHKRLIHSEAGRALLTASRVGSGSTGDDAQYLAAAGYEPFEINMALGMLEEARAVYMRLATTNPLNKGNPSKNYGALLAEELDALAIERELEMMVLFNNSLAFSCNPARFFFLWPWLVLRMQLLFQGYTDLEISKFLLEADPEASGRVSLPAFLTAAPVIFGGLENFDNFDVVSPSSPTAREGWSSQVQE